MRSTCCRCGNPVLLSEHIGTLASIAFAAVGADERKRVSTFERNLAVIRTLLAGGDVDGSRVAPIPSEPVEVWIGGSADAAIDRAAQLGDGFLARPNITADEAGVQVELYRERCTAHGRPVCVTAIRRDIHVGADTDDARHVAEPARMKPTSSSRRSSARSAAC